MSYYSRYQGSNYVYDNSKIPSPAYPDKNGSPATNDPTVSQYSKYTRTTDSNNLIKKDDKKLNLVPNGANRISIATTNYYDEPNRDNKTKEIKMEQFKIQTKEANKNKDQTFDWLTHTFICLSSSENNSKKKIQKIYQIIKSNQKNFSKAIIYAETAYSSRQILNYFDNKFRKDVKIINTSHSQQQAKNIYMQFILPQFKILITTQQPKQLNQEAMIDIEDVNLIIFQVLPTNPTDYKSRLIRSPKLNEGAKGIVVSFTSQTYSYSLYKYVPNVEQHQKNLNIKFEEFKGNVSPYIKKGIQKTNLQKKDNYLKKQEKNQYLQQELNPREKTKDKNLFRIEEIKKQEMRPASRKNETTKKNQGGISLISKMERQPEDQSVNHIKHLGKNTGTIKLNIEKQQEIGRQKTKEKYGHKYLDENQESDVTKTRLGGKKAIQKNQRQQTPKIKMQKIQQQSSGIKYSGMKKEQTQKLLNKVYSLEEYLKKQGQDFKKNINVTDQIKNNTQNVKQIPDQTAKLIQKQMKSLENNIGNKIDHYSKQFNEVKKQMQSNVPKHLLQKLMSLIEKTGSQSKQGNKQILKHLVRVEENQNSLTLKVNSNSPENTKQIRKLKQQNQLKDREMKKIKDQYQYKIAELQKNQTSSRIIRQSSYSRGNQSFQQFLRDFNSIIRQCLNINSNISTINYKTELLKLKAVLQKNNRYLQQIQQFFHCINKLLHEHSISPLKLDNYEGPIQQLGRKLSQKNIGYNSMNNSKNNNNQSSFLCESNLYESFTDIQKEFLFQTVKGILGRKQIKKTKTLFELDKNEQNDYHGWLLKIKKKPNLLMLVVLDNDQVLASFTQNYFTFKYEDQGRNGDGAIMNLTTLKRYNLKEKGKGVRSDDYIFGLGNNEVLIKPNFKLGVIISRAYNVYNTANVTNKQFYGYEDDECGYKKLEFHQVLTK